MRTLDALFRPKSIAVLGSGWARNVIEQCGKMGFAGEVWPIHPTKPEIGGLPAYARLADLPGPPDACFIGVNRHATVEIVAELSAMGAGGAICFASGWSETGERDLQARLVAAAGEMPILGPNCYGVLNYLDGAAIWPDQHGGTRVARGVGIITQSSNIGINLTMQRRGLPIAYLACVGNAAQSGPSDFARAMLADDRVTALGFYLEGIDDPAALAEIAEAARAAGKGIVALKGGKSDAGVAAAASHTASLAGGRAASSAFLAQAGIAEVETPAQLLEVLKVFHDHGPLRGRRISSTSCSGGEAGLVADLAAGTALEFPALDPRRKARLFDVLGPLVTLSNPLDYHTFIWGDEAATTKVFSAMLEDMDAGIFVIDPPRSDRNSTESYQPAFNAIVAAAAETGRPAFAVSLLSETCSEEDALALMARGVTPLLGLETALAALDAAATAPGRPGWRPLPRAPEGETRMLDEAEGKALLRQAGIAVPRGVSAPDLAALVRAAEGLQPPLALKGLGFAHKSEAGAVRLGLSSLAGQPEIAGAQGYLAEEMVMGAVAELLVGLRRDPVYGATLTLGMGGVTAELLEDTVTLILPVLRAEVADALRRLRLWPLLDGYRGRARPDLEAFLDAVMALQTLIADDQGLVEIEVNPIILTETGAVAADALIRKAV